VTDYSILNTVNPDSGSRQTLGIGRAKVQIDDLSLVQGYQSGLTLIVELSVIESDNASDAPGASRKIAITGLDNRQKMEMQWGRVKSLLAAVYNIDASAPVPMPGQTWESLFSFAVDGTGALNGQQFNAESYEKTTKAGQPFRIWAFSPATK